MGEPADPSTRAAASGGGVRHAWRTFALKISFGGQPLEKFTGTSQVPHKNLGALLAPTEHRALGRLAVIALAALLGRHTAHDVVDVLAASGVGRFVALLAGGRSAHFHSSCRGLGG